FQDELLRGADRVPERHHPHRGVRRQGAADQRLGRALVGEDEECETVEAHPRPPSDWYTSCGRTPSISVSAVTMDGGRVFAPELGRSASQSFPLSEANVSCVACLSLNLKSTFPFLMPAT